MRVDPLDSAELPVRDATLTIGSGHLHAVARSKGPLGFPMHGHTLQPSWVVGHSAVVIGFDRDLIGLRVHPFDARVVPPFDTEGLAAAAVTNDVTFLVALRALPIRSGDLLARREHGRLMLVAADMALPLHRAMDDVVEILSRLIVRRHDEGRRDRSPLAR